MEVQEAQASAVNSYYRIYASMPMGVREFTNESIRMVLGVNYGKDIASPEKFSAWWEYQWKYPIDGQCWADRFVSWNGKGNCYKSDICYDDF